MLKYTINNYDCESFKRNCKKIIYTCVGELYLKFFFTHASHCINRHYLKKTYTYYIDP